MNVLIEQLTTLKLHGMAQVAQELLAVSKPPALQRVLQLLIEAETTERQVRSIRYQMTAAKFPHHKDFATFDYGSSDIDETLIEKAG